MAVADDLWPRHSEECLMDERTKSLIDECRRQEESCLYTSTALFEWAKHLRFWKIVFVVVPIVLAGAATGIQPGLSSWTGPLVTICTVFAGIATAVYKALNLDVSLEFVTKQANQFKISQDGFRQAWRIQARANADDFAQHFGDLMERQDELRLASPLPPERFFHRAKKKVESGEYEFDVDRKASD